MSELAPPALFQWEGDVMRPFKAEPTHYRVGRVYALAEVSSRSPQSHKQYFAAISEAWANLPEQYRDEWWSKSPEALRKYALIEEGFCDTSSFQFGDASSALEAAIEFRQRDPHSETLVSLRHRVTWSTAHSQAGGKMDKAMFEKSKDAVLSFLANLLDVPKEALIERGKTAA